MTNPRDILNRHANAIIEKLVERALAGDNAAIQACVERILPRNKPDHPLNILLPEGSINSADNMLAITNSITHAVATGEMNIDDADKFNKFLKYQRWQLDEVERKKEDEKWKI